MSFKSAPVVIAATDTDVYTCPTGTEAAVVLGLNNVTGTAATFTLKFYKASTASTITLVSGKSIAANNETKVSYPIAMEAGDKIVVLGSTASAIVAFGTISQGSPGPQFTGITPMGVYSGATTYAINNAVELSGTSYMSLVDDNVGNSPDSSPAYWMVLAEKGATGASGIDSLFDTALGKSESQKEQARANMGAPDGQYRNLLINPLFDINQRAVSGTVVLSAGAYGHDRFKAGSGGCTYTFSTSNGVTTLNISAGTLVQVIPAAAFAGRPGTYFASWTGTAQARIDAGAYGDSGEVSATCDGSANVTLEFGTGTVSLPQFERGYVTDFSARHPNAEKVLCQHYCRIVPEKTVALTGFQTNTLTNAFYPVKFDTPMRTTPTISYASLVNFLVFLFNSGSANAPISLTLRYASVDGLILDFVWGTPGGASGSAASLDIFGGDKIVIDAEL